MLADEKKFLSVEQISSYCNVPIATVNRWIAKGFMGANLKKKNVLLEDFILFLNGHKLPDENKKNSTALKVLIVDNETVVADVIGDIFHSRGFSVVRSKDAIEAGCLIKNELPEIVTVDLSMNAFDGLDVIKIINGLELRKRIWVIVISACDEDTLKGAVNLGADCYLQKPFSNCDLEKLINRFYPHKVKIAA